ncbi:MAG: dihydrofolate reductase family protein [SAR324 cluster bacterium]|nr:dihydrofolate reductase family protein [SAR324 cluster bacterium]
MNLQASVFIATSLDGYIARENGDVDWLIAANTQVPAGEDCGFFVFMESVDVLVMGSRSFEKVLSFGEWPYGEKAVVVLSHRNLTIPGPLQNTVTLSSESPAALCDRLSQNGVKRLYVDGGAIIQSFLKAGLLTDFTITAIPVLLGKGIPLFGDLEADLPLEHQETKVYDFGFVQSKYRMNPHLSR